MWYCVIPLATTGRFEALVNRGCKVMRVGKRVTSVACEKSIYSLILENLG